jgi:site-specific recombinase XerD
VRGKGDKDRYVFYDEDTNNLIVDYIKNDWDLLKQEPTEYIFLNRFGKKISERSVELILQEKGRKMKNPKEIYPHMIRHTYASCMLESGADLRVIQELLGHTSLQTTQVYTSLSNHKLQKNYLDSHPHSQKK